MLTSGDREIIDLERTWWQQPGPKEASIRERMGLDASAYYRRLGQLLFDPEAEAYDPLTIRRLRRSLTTSHPSAGRS